MMDDDLEIAALVYFKVLSQYFPREFEENHKSIGYNLTSYCRVGSVSADLCTAIMDTFLFVLYVSS
jgi:hypothetical protein